VPAASRLRVHDAFIVRYDAENDKSLSLPEHCDTSSMSVILSLNEQDDGDDENEKEKEEEGRGTPGTVALVENSGMKAPSMYRIGELFILSFLRFEIHGFI
jgi:hypothetical protein